MSPGGAVPVGAGGRRTALGATVGQKPVLGSTWGGKNGGNGSRAGAAPSCISSHRRCDPGPAAPTAASLQNLHLCEGYVGPDGRYHPGFCCPRLTDPATHRYCCRPGPHALRGCCSRLGVEVLTGLNISGLPAPGLLR